MKFVCSNCGKEFSQRQSSRKYSAKFCNRACYLTNHSSGDHVLRFWSHVHKTESCWLWTAGVNRSGYGKFSINGKTVGAHRYSWVISHGPIENPILEVCHNCPGGDNPTCVNPDHLFLGTPKENALDAVKKGMKPKGSGHGMAIVNESAVINIRGLHANGTPVKEIAKMFGLSFGGVGSIIYRRNWTHI